MTLERPAGGDQASFASYCVVIYTTPVITTVSV